jgi:GDP-mannose 6-dehydrogenase
MLTIKGQLSVFGLGYVGSVTAACLAAAGYRVMGVDVSPVKIQLMRQGRPTVQGEYGLPELSGYAFALGLLNATDDHTAAVNGSDTTIVCVPTPSTHDGGVDLSAIEAVSRQLGEAIHHKPHPHTVIFRSTVPPGTTEDWSIRIIESKSGKTHGKDFWVYFVPEFLREGTAVQDFTFPEFSIIGAPPNAPQLTLFARPKVTTIRAAEMAKYVSNAWHAVKVAFANEVGSIACHFNVDPYEVTQLFISDTKLNISSAYMRPGFGFGGSCLPKDLRGLTFNAGKLGVDAPLLGSVLASNQEHIHRWGRRVLRAGSKGDKTFWVLGSGFKQGAPGDERESPMTTLLEYIVENGMKSATSAETAAVVIIGHNADPYVMQPGQQVLDVNRMTVGTNGRKTEPL